MDEEFPPVRAEGDGAPIKERAKPARIPNTI